MRLRHLEMALQRLSGFPAPRPELEQYATPAVVAARLLYHAAGEGAIRECRVLDLGCGTGVLAGGAALLGAETVAGIDCDRGALGVARKNAAALGVDLDLIRGEVGGRFPIRADTFDTVVMNPPFGAQRRHADRPFIDCALSTAPVVYGIFNAGSRRFVERYIGDRAMITAAVGGAFTIPRTFSFHRREAVEIAVEVLRIERGAGC
ncbi:METTL5 family protein [Methanofollis fontis]|uniref:Methyltransferase-like protein 5 n=1 Tax=Methanofollis fontis TaxID=2052832 RepID=A0A483CSP4_9EURY|nr:METTL5 family protein [Methanofollis fontis]TAJ43538.1 methyltransferase [Methanofollis fontis]